MTMNEIAKLYEHMDDDLHSKERHSLTDESIPVEKMSLQQLLQYRYYSPSNSRMRCRARRLIDEECYAAIKAELPANGWPDEDFDNRARKIKEQYANYAKTLKVREEDWLNDTNK